LKYNYDIKFINCAEILSEVESLKFQCSSIVDDAQSASSIDLVNAIHRIGLQEVYPNICIALRLFLTLPVTVATCVCSFNKLKVHNERINELMKNVLIYHPRLKTWLALISIEHEAASRIDYVDIITPLPVAKKEKSFCNFFQ